MKTEKVALMTNAAVTTIEMCEIDDKGDVVQANIEG